MLRQLLRPHQRNHQNSIKPRPQKLPTRRPPTTTQSNQRRIRRHARHNQSRHPHRRQQHNQATKMHRPNHSQQRRISITQRNSPNHSTPKQKRLPEHPSPIPQNHYPSKSTTSPGSTSHHQRTIIKLQPQLKLHSPAQPHHHQPRQLNRKQQPSTMPHNIRTNPQRQPNLHHQRHVPTTIIKSPQASHQISPPTHSNKKQGAHSSTYRARRRQSTSNAHGNDEPHNGQKRLPLKRKRSPNPQTSNRRPTRQRTTRQPIKLRQGAQRHPLRTTRK